MRQGNGDGAEERGCFLKGRLRRTLRPGFGGAIVLMVERNRKALQLSDE